MNTNTGEVQVFSDSEMKELINNQKNVANGEKQTWIPVGAIISINGYDAQWRVTAMKSGGRLFLKLVKG